MKEFILYILRKIIKQENLTALGRWNLDYCQKRVKYKVDNANIDHCGTCSKTNTKKTKVNDLK